MGCRKYSVFWAFVVLCILLSFTHRFFAAKSDNIPPNTARADADRPDLWVDPSDMLGVDLSSFTQGGQTDDHEQEEQEDLDLMSEKTAPKKRSLSTSHTSDSREVVDSAAFGPVRNCDLPLFKQLTRTIIESFEIPGKRYATIDLSEEDFEVMQQFKDKGEQIHDVLEVIVGIFKRIQDSEKLEKNFFSHLMIAVDLNQGLLAGFMVVFFLFVIFVSFESRTALPWSLQCWYFFVGVFLCSLPWEWFRLYRLEYARKQSEFLKEIPRHCIPRNMTIVERMSALMAGLLSWKGDECSKFQEAMLVDPLWEVSPSLALSITTTRLIFKPLESIADSCGKSLGLFFVHVPGVWQPVMLGLMVLILLLCLLFLTKTRISFGFFEIGPAVQQKLQLEDMKVLGDYVRQEIQATLRREGLPHRGRHYEELPQMNAVQEERAGDNCPRGVRETESPVYDLPLKEGPSG